MYSASQVECLNDISSECSELLDCDVKNNVKNDLYWKLRNPLNCLSELGLPIFQMCLEPGFQKDSCSSTNYLIFILTRSCIE